MPGDLSDFVGKKKRTCRLQMGTTQDRNHVMLFLLPLQKTSSLKSRSRHVLYITEEEAGCRNSVIAINRHKAKTIID